MTQGAATATQRLVPSLLGMTPSFGFGDRLGLATPGHLAALLEAGGPIRGIFAQQSVREMTRTQRTPSEVLSAAAEALEAAEYREPWSADADHHKHPDDIRRAVEAGFVFFTLDPSDEVDQHADRYDAATLAAKLAERRGDAEWLDSYRGQELKFASGRIKFDDETLARAAVKYGRAIKRTRALARSVADEAGRKRQPFEIELSVDETAEPTTPAEHFIFADQLRRAGVRIVSLAPRLVGDFEKGVDFKGDMAAFEQSLALHAEIAAELGPYKISLHSGSDKLSIYPALARITGGRFHVKTAGTSYMEALRVAAQHDESLFRAIVDLSRDRYDTDKATYHVSATLATTPPQEAISDPVELERIYIERWEDVPEGRGFTAPGRQILHCTFGSVLTDPQLGPALVELVRARQDDYTEILRQHFVRHFRALA